MSTTVPGQGHKGSLTLGKEATFAGGASPQWKFDFLDWLRPIETALRRVLLIEARRERVAEQVEVVVHVVVARVVAVAVLLVTLLALAPAANAGTVMSTTGCPTTALALQTAAADVPQVAPGFGECDDDPGTVCEQNLSLVTSCGDCKTSCTSTNGSVAITEVAPWSSGTSIGSDWFELTNTGATAINAGLILQRCLARDPSDRFPTARQLELALSDGAGGLFLCGWLRDPLV